MSDKEVTKLCGICGDKAHGYNFNAVTCESCKAFFRRNALRKKEFKCPFEGNCKIDSVTRKFCKKCRLKKCFDIGMKKEWILSEDEKQTLRNKIAENRRKRTNSSKVAKVADSTTTTYQFPNVVQLIHHNPSAYDMTSSDGPVVTQSPVKISAQQDIEMNSIIKYADNSMITSSTVEPKYMPELQQVFAEASHNCSVMPSYTSNPLKPFNIELSDCTKCVNNLNTKNDDFTHITNLDNNYINITSEVQTNSNQCSVITDASIETIKNICIESIGAFASKPNEMKTEMIENNNKYNGISDSVYQKAIEMEFSSIPFKEFSVEEFNRFESFRINELRTAIIDLNNRVYGKCNNNYQITNEVNDVIDVTKLLAMKCDQAIRKLVVMSKKINSFGSLCQHDQIALMKAGCFEMLIIRSIQNYNYEHDYWAVIMDQNNVTKLKLEVFKQYQKGNLYEAHRKFMHTFKEEWDKDHTVLDLLTAILLFTPERPNIMHREIIKLEQQTYMYLLQRYLISKYQNKCEAKLKFLRLMSNLEELHILNEKHVKIYLEVDPQDVGPLLIEILDLNPYTNSTLQVL
ncbi:nuclear hormone receptor HR96-like [Oppia nitens]|uniref:nuclear hormone receptor HR96-like n=1 Tax=Oppia nitens TaxID=1686743 RepID=UPI0023DB376D|nr:nuclear hormone receptor HR96-like [Oppia nitens]